MSTELSVTPATTTTGLTNNPSTTTNTMGDNLQSSSKPSSTPPKERTAVDSKEPTRISRKRTKTGCLTCRRRRIKCGEEKPHCNNCIKSKRMCDYKARAAFRRFPFHHIQDTNSYNYQSMPMHSSGFNGHAGYDYHMSGFPYGSQSQSPIVALPPHYTQSPSFMTPAFSHGRSVSCDTLPPFWAGPSFHPAGDNGHDGSPIGFPTSSMAGNQSYHSSPTASAEPQSAPLQSSWSSENQKTGRPVLSKIVTDSPQARDISSFQNTACVQKRPQLGNLSLGRRSINEWYGYQLQDERSGRQDFGAPATAPPFRHEHSSPYPWTSITPESESTTPSTTRPDLSSSMENSLFANEPMSAPQFGGMVSPFSPDISRWLPSKSCISHQDVKPMFESSIKELGAEDSFDQLLEPRTPIDAHHPQQSMITTKVAT